MNLHQLKALFRRHVEGTLSEEELIELRSALLVAEHNEEIQQMLDAVWEELPESDVTEERAAAIYKAIVAKKKTRKLNFYWPRIAAGFLIILSVGLLFKSINRSTVKNTSNAKTDLISNKITPGQNSAVLTLSDGTEIALNEQVEGQLATQNGVVVKKLKDGQLAYLANTLDKNQTVLFNTIKTPMGGQYKVVLPDGTQVWLNAGSSLRYPVYFSGSERRVELKGEAYFEVAKNKAMPFKVMAKSAQVKVLGTHFNVMSYTDERHVNTTLIEGSVNVNNAILVPGQQASIDNRTRNLSVRYVKVDEAIAWKNGLFIFRNEDIQSIMKKISRWYNVEVVFKDKIQNKSFGGTFSRSGNLSDMLHSMELTGEINFKVEGRRITVMN